MDLEQADASFPTTQWTLIDALQSPAHPGHAEALEKMLTCYWPAVYAHLRRLGKDPETAAELTQGFFVDVVISRELFAQADPDRGRLRRLVHAALKRYLCDQHRRQTARRLAFQVPLDQIEREEQFLIGEADADADQTFDRRWAASVLDEAVRRCQQHCLASGQDRHWKAFESYALQPAVAGTAPPSLAQVAAEAGFARPEQVTVALRTVKKRLRVLLHDVAARTASNPGEQHAEFRDVLQLLS